jgi:Phage ABA sandwich domain
MATCLRQTMKSKEEITTAEINELVARKLGWICGGPDQSDPFETVWYGPNQETKIPAYSTSIEAAWEIVPRIEDFELIQYCNKWLVMTGFLDDSETLAEADTAPMAICLAFLKL